MKIIVLQGMPDTGKTTTLLSFYQEIIPESDKDFIEPLEYIGDKKDIKCLFSKDGLIVGFFTMGDWSKQLYRAIRYYAEETECQVLIIALSTNSPKPDANYMINKHDSTRFEKTVGDPNDKASQERCNDADLEILLSHYNNLKP